MEDQFNFELRKKVLFSSMMLEGLISVFLGWLMNIKDRNNSISFGNKSTALSFNQKINLLIDVGALSKTDQNKFQKFMEIRNQLAHNLNVTSLEKCCENIAGLDKYLLKNYPDYDVKSAKESQLEYCLDKLTEDIFDMVDKIEAHLKEKIKTDVSRDLSVISDKAFASSVKYVELYIKNYLYEAEDEHGMIDSKDLATLASDVYYRFFSEWKSQYNELLKTSEKSE